jgi:hypothetical protein
MFHNCVSVIVTSRAIRKYSRVPFFLTNVYDGTICFFNEVNETLYRHNNHIHYTSDGDLDLVVGLTTDNSNI